MTPDVERAVERLQLAVDESRMGQADLDFIVRTIEAYELLVDAPKPKPPAPVEVEREPIEPSEGLEEFLAYARRAAQKIEPGSVDWEDSPLEWMKAHSPRVKSMMAKDIVREWLGNTSDSEAGLAHFLVAGEPTMVHIGMVGKEAKIEFSQLAADGMGVDRILLLGIEPDRVRIWEISPRIVSGFPSYGQQIDGLHHCTIDPDEIPPWAREIVCWNGGA